MTGPRARPFQRLRKRAEFVAASRGKKVSTKSFLLQACDRGDQGPARFGFTVSKKVGTAIERNRVRRRLREMVRTSGVAAKSGHDYVLIGRRAALALPFPELLADFERALRQLDGRGDRQPTGGVDAHARDERPTEGPR